MSRLLESGKNFALEQVGKLMWEEGVMRTPFKIEFHASPTQLIHQVLYGNGVMLIHNHAATADPAYVIRGINQLFHEKHITSGYVASYKFVDGRMAFEQSIMDYILKNGLLRTIWPVIQKNDNEKRQLLDPAEVRKINVEAKEHMYSTMQKGNCIVCISPEGTRSDDGTIKVTNTRQAIGKTYELFQRADEYKLKLLPVALEGTDKVFKKGDRVPKVWKSVTMHIGGLLSIEQVKQITNETGIPSDIAMMVPLAAMLPERYWGELYPSMHMLDEYKYLEAFRGEEIQKMVRTITSRPKAEDEFII